MAVHIFLFLENGALEAWLLAEEVSDQDGFKDSLLEVDLARGGGIGENLALDIGE